MTEARNIRIALSYDDWGLISGALGEQGQAEGNLPLLSLAALIERSIGNAATAMCLEAECERLSRRPRSNVK